LVRPGESPELRAGGARPRMRPVRSTPASKVAQPACADRTRIMTALGWSEDRFRLLFMALVHEGKEAVWSMGDDTPPAFLSGLRRPLWDYCKQRFAQVTNPSIDPLRERHVMSLNVYVGGGTVLPSPLLDPGQLKALL